MIIQTNLKYHFLNVTQDYMNADSHPFDLCMLTQHVVCNLQGSLLPLVSLNYALNQWRGALIRTIER